MTRTLFCALVLGSAVSWAAPIVVSHEGRLLDGDDQPLSGPVSLTFSLWANAEASDASFLVWPPEGESATCSVVVSHGLYGVSLGDDTCGTGLTTDALPVGEARWLQVEVEGTKLLPRLRLGQAPTAGLAAIAEDARLLGGLPAEAFWTKAEDLSDAIVGTATVGTLARREEANTFTAPNAFEQKVTFGAGPDTVVVEDGLVAGRFVGPLEGDVTGNLTGDVTGNLTGNVTGTVTGDVTGNLTGNVQGHLVGSVAGDGSALQGLGAARLGDGSSASLGDALFGKVDSVTAGTGLTSTGSDNAPTFAVVYGTTAGTAAQGNDARLTNDRNPTAGSSHYVHNGTTPQTGSFNLSGTGTLGGDLTLGGHLMYGTYKEFRPYLVENFNGALSGWSRTTTTCGGQTIMGGYNQAGRNLSITKEFTGLPTHTEVKVRLQYYAIDSWDGEWAYVDVGASSTTVWRCWQQNLRHVDGTRSLCGRANYGDQVHSVECWVPHTDSDLYFVAGARLDSGVDDESFGIDNLEIWLR